MLVKILWSFLEKETSKKNFGTRLSTEREREREREREKHFVWIRWFTIYSPVDETGTIANDSERQQTTVR